MVTKKTTTKTKKSMFDKMSSSSKEGNKKYFAAHNKENCKKLMDFNINKIVALDELGTTFSEWAAKNELVLNIMPLCDAFNTPIKTTKTISGTKIKLMPEHNKQEYRISTIDNIKHGEVLYFKKQNLIITTINPFVNKETFEYILKSIKHINPKVVTDKDLLAIELSEIATKHVKVKRVELDTALTQGRYDIIDIEKKHMQKLKKLKEQTLERKLIGDNNGVELDKLSKEVKTILEMPVVKKLFIKDGNIHINFGKVSVIGNVIVGTTKKKGICVPDVKLEKVNLGELEFTIGEGIVTCKNLTYTKDNPHPHASNEGSCCFGDSATALNKLIVDFKLIELTKMLYAWSLSYNEAGGPHKMIQFFYDRAKGKA